MYSALALAIQPRKHRDNVIFGFLIGQSWEINEKSDVARVIQNSVISEALRRTEKRQDKTDKS
jgi:hypothetical protein